MTEEEREGMELLLRDPEIVAWLGPDDDERGEEDT